MDIRIRPACLEDIPAIATLIPESQRGSSSCCSDVQAFR